MTKLLAALFAAVATLGGSTAIIDQLQPGAEAMAAHTAINSLVTEARALALLSGETDMENALAEARGDIPTPDDGAIVVEGIDITVWAGDSCFFAEVETVNSPVEIVAC